MVWSRGFSVEAPTSSSGSEMSRLDLILLLTPGEYNTSQFESFIHEGVVVVVPLGGTACTADSPSPFGPMSSTGVVFWARSVGLRIVILSVQNSSASFSTALYQHNYKVNL